jgi:hypothetical protein
MLPDWDAEAAVVGADGRVGRSRNLANRQSREGSGVLTVESAQERQY